MGTYKIQDYKIEELMQDMKKGEYIIPNFQRDFVWKSEKIVDLFSSILHNYPIGVLTSSSSKKSTLASGKNEIIEGISDREDRANWIIVDGQQRLTSLTIVYFASVLQKNISKFSDDTKDFLKKCFDEILFWGNKFYRKKDLREKFAAMKWEKSLIAEKLREFSVANPTTNDEIKKMISDYSIQILRLEEWQDEEVIEIFTAMNKGAKPLTHVDLMNGSMYNLGNGFDLLKQIKAINSSFKNMGEIKPEFMVQLMKVYFDIKHSSNEEVDYKKQELLRWSLDKSQVSLFIEKVDDFKQMLISALSYLDTKFGFYSIETLPKNVYLVSALAIMTKSATLGKDVSKDIWKKVISFITKRLVDGDYASSPGQKTQEDINKYIIPLINGKTDFEHSKKELIEKDLWQDLLSEVKKLSYANKESALFKLATSVLKNKHPKMLFDKGYVPVRPTEVTKLDTDLHHFIPKKSSFVIERGISEEVINSIGNIILITADENRNEIRDKDLPVYIEKAKQVHNDFKSVLESHVIDWEELEKIINISDNDSPVAVHKKIKEFFDNRTNVLATMIYEEFMEVK